MVREAKKSLPSADYTRRTFVKGAATAVAAAGAGALAGCAPDKAGDPEDLSETGQNTPDIPEEVFTSFCRGYCTNMCPIDLHVRNGKLCYCSPHSFSEEGYRRICAKGYAHPFRMESENQLMKPLRRSGERGSGQWEEISWDEALDEIAAKWREITDEYGPSAMASYIMTGNFGSLNGWGWGSPFNRFTTVLGMTPISHANDAAATYVLDRMFGNDYYRSANEATDWKNSKTILIWGANPAVSQMQNMHYLLDAQQQGTQLVVIDPVHSATAAVADRFVGVRPGSDGALAFGMMNVVVENDWQDLEYLTRCTVAPFLVKSSDHKFLRLSDLGRAEAGSEEDAIVVRDENGSYDVPDNVENPLIEGSFEVNGINVTCAYTLLLNRIAEYPVDRAAELTGLSEATIREVAELYATNTPSAIYTVFGVDHYYNGHWSEGCIAALAMLTGNMSRPGSFCGAPILEGTHPYDIEWVTDVPTPAEPPKSVFITKLDEPINKGVYNGESRVIKGMYVTCANPVGNVGNRELTLQWINGLELLVVVDVVMSETALYADYVLPAAYWFETDEMMSLSRNYPFCAYGEKVFEPHGESKSDFEIYRLLADKLGVGEYFQLSEEEWIRQLLDSDDARSFGLTYESLTTEKMIRVAPEEFVYAHDGIYPTATGRAQFYVEDPQPTNDDPTLWDFDKEYLPYWEPPYEVWGGPNYNPAYPLQLFTSHSPYRTHTQWFDAGPIQEISAEPLLSINPEDASTYGLVDGDTVRVFNERGSVTIKAAIRNNIPQGMVSAYKGFTSEQFIDGHLSNLTPNHMNPFCGNTPYYDCAVAIEKL